MMVPAVTEVWRPHPAHSNVQALVSSCQGFATTAARTNKPVGPTRRDQILRARCLVAEALLELDKRTGKVCHMVIAQNGTCS